MSRQENFRRYVELGKTAVSQGAVVARQVAGKVSAEAARQADIAKPIVQEASRKAWVEIQRQATVAKPVVQAATKRAVASGLKTSRQAGRLIGAATQRGFEQAVPWLRQMHRKYPLLGKASLACAAGLVGMVVLAGSGWFSRGVSTPAVTAEIQQNSPNFYAGFQPAVEPSAEETQVVEQAATETDEIAQTEHTNVFEQWRRQPPPTTAEYEGSMQQWNAQAAPRQLGFTPQQMGRFAAAGYRPHLQPQQYPR